MASLLGFGESKQPSTFGSTLTQSNTTKDDVQSSTKETPEVNPQVGQTLQTTPPEVKPEQSALTKAIGSLEQTLAGNDPFTQSLLSGQTQQNAAGDAAREAAARQRANQAGLSQTRQDIQQGQVTRDVEAARAEATGDTAVDLANQRTQVAGQLGQLGVQQEQLGLQEEQIDLNNYNNLLANVDYFDEAAMAELTKQGKKIYGEDYNPSYTELKTSAYDARESAGKIGVTDYLVANGSSFQLDDGTYSFYGADGTITDPVLAENIEDWYEGATEGLSIYGEDGKTLTDEAKAFIDSQGRRLSQTATSAALDTKLQEIKEIYGNDPEQLELWTTFIQDNLDIVTSGYDTKLIELPDGKVVGLDVATGQIVGDSGNYNVDYNEDIGGAYVTLDDGSLSVLGEGGNQGTLYFKKDGKLWEQGENGVIEITGDKADKINTLMEGKDPDVESVSVTIPDGVTEGGVWIDEDSGEFYSKTGKNPTVIAIGSVTPGSTDYTKLLKLAIDDSAMGKKLYDSGMFDSTTTMAEKEGFMGSDGDGGFQMQGNEANEVVKLKDGVVGYYPKAYDGGTYYKDFVILHDPTGKFSDGETVEMSGHNGFDRDLLRFGQVDGRNRPHMTAGVTKTGGRG